MSGSDRVETHIKRHVRRLFETSSRRRKIDYIEYRRAKIICTPQYDVRHVRNSTSLRCVCTRRDVIITSQTRQYSRLVCAYGSKKFRVGERRVLYSRKYHDKILCRPVLTRCKRDHVNTTACIFRVQFVRSTFYARKIRL